MEPNGRAVSESRLGAWLIKVSPTVFPVSELVRTEFTTVESRCVRPSYRTDLIREGQPVLLWVSGRDHRFPAGLYAAGRTTGPVCLQAEPAMPLRLRPIDPMVSRESLLAHPDLGGIEVLRMPAGSNPSYLDREQYRALRSAFPQVATG
jgi:hypothetical protein